MQTEELRQLGNRDLRQNRLRKSWVTGHPAARIAIGRYVNKHQYQNIRYY